MGLSPGQRRAEQEWWITDFIEDAIIDLRPDVDWTKRNVVKLVEKHKQEIIDKLKEVAGDIARTVKVRRKPNAK